jgi:hypothetical protein
MGYQIKTQKMTMKNRIENFEQYDPVLPSRRLSMNLKERKELNEWSYNWTSRVNYVEDAEWWDMGPLAEWDPGVPADKFTNPYWPNESGADDYLFYEPKMELRLAIMRYNFLLYRSWFLKHIEKGPTCVVVRNDFFEEASRELEGCWVMGHDPTIGRMIERTDPLMEMSFEKRIYSELLAKCGQNRGKAV